MTVKLKSGFSAPTQIEVASTLVRARPLPVSVIAMSRFVLLTDYKLRIQ
jgi:hypothetical protein